MMSKLLYPGDGLDRHALPGPPVDPDVNVGEGAVADRVRQPEPVGVEFKWFCRRPEDANRA